MSVFDLPLLFTDNDGSNPAVSPMQFKALGWKAICAQAMNVTDPQGANRPFEKPVNLAAYESLGFETGIWGITYGQGDFERDAAIISGIAIRGDYRFLIWDAEQVLKDASSAALETALRIFQGFRGEKAVSVLGAPAGSNVFPIDTDVFLRYGWHILPQAYTSTDVAYRPELCVEHWHGRKGVPLDRLHLTVDSYDGDYRPATGERQGAEEIVRDLRAAGMSSPDLSVFMAEYGDLAFYTKLKEITMQVAKPEPSTPTQAGLAMIQTGTAQLDRWRAQHQADRIIRRTRIGLAMRTLSMNDDQLRQRVDALDKTLPQ